MAALRIPEGSGSTVLSTLVLSRSDQTPTPEAAAGLSRKRLATVAGLVVVAGLVTWFATSANRDGGNPILGTASGDPKMVESTEVKTIADEIGHTVFWAGERPDTKIELRHDELGNTHVRYLTGGAEPGDPDPAYLDIGTYPFENGYSVLSQMAAEDGRKQVKVGDAVGFYDPARPTNIYLGFPDRPDFQVEVFHPDPDGALEVVRSGDIVPMP
jgi:hypothetical protein